MVLRGGRLTFLYWLKEEKLAFKATSWLMDLRRDLKRFTGSGSVDEEEVQRMGSNKDRRWGIAFYAMRKERIMVNSYRASRLDISSKHKVQTS